MISSLKIHSILSGYNISWLGIICTFYLKKKHIQKKLATSLISSPFREGINMLYFALVVNIRTLNRKRTPRT